MMSDAESPADKLHQDNHQDSHQDNHQDNHQDTTSPEARMVEDKSTVATQLKVSAGKK